MKLDKMCLLDFKFGHVFPLIKPFVDLGDNCISNFNLEAYIVGYTVGNLVLRRRASGVVKRDFRTLIRKWILVSK